MHLVKLEFVLSLSTLLCGCIGVIPISQQTRTSQGKHEDVELGFIKPGTTTRMEVSQKLKFIDAGLSSSRYLLGRWSSSTSAGWLITGGAIAGEDSGGRRWKSENILVEFGTDGVVINATRILDSNIVSALAPVAAENKVPDFPIELRIKYWKNGYKQSIPSKITLSSDVFSFEELGTLKKRHKFVVPRRDVVRISTPISKPNGDPAYTTQTLHFATHLKKLGGPSEKEVDIEVSLPGLVDLISYVSQNSRGVSFSSAIDNVRLVHSVGEQPGIMSYANCWGAELGEMRDGHGVAREFTAPERSDPLLPCTETETARRHEYGPFDWSEPSRRLGRYSGVGSIFSSQLQRRSFPPPERYRLAGLAVRALPQLRQETRRSSLVSRLRN